MHIFGCKFSLRTDTGDTVPDRKNFDSLLWAIVTVFQVSGSRTFMVFRGEISRQQVWGRLRLMGGLCLGGLGLGLDQG